MIVRERPAGLMLIRQTEHARICGVMARAWGNERFASPEPLEPIAYAAAEHDNGWEEWEDDPRLNAATGRPYTYIDIPIDQHLEIYRRGIRRVLERDRYAGLLVSLHGTLLYSRFRTGQPGAREFVEDQGILQEELVREMRDHDPRGAYCEEPILTANRDLLFAWDALSLSLCHGSARLGELRVPTDYSEDREPIQLRHEDGHWLLDPFPFRSAPVTVSVQAIEIDASEFENQNALRGALENARVREMELVLRRYIGESVHR